MLKGRILCSVVVIFSHGVAQCSAQQHRYMDSSGNIHFVDNVYQVPQRYREQVMTPTPVPVLDRKALMEKQRLEQQAKREKMAEERRKQIEERQKKREDERRRAQEAKLNKLKGQQSGFGRVR
jgi:hypothetical protein